MYFFRRKILLNEFIINKKSIKIQYLLSFSLIIGVSSLCLIFSSYIYFDLFAYASLLTLSLIAMFCDIVPVLISATLCALIWDFFFIKPRFHFQVGNEQDRIMLSMYFVIALLSAVLTFRIRQIERIAGKKQERAKALQLYDALFDSLSHELKTPIATIIGASDNLLENSRKLSPENRADLLREISKASMRLDRQVENLLDMSRIESSYIKPKKEWYNAGELIYEVVQRLDEELKNHAVHISVKENLPLVKIDYGLMEQVIYNLIYNAAQHTQPQSSINIIVECVSDLIITIEDDGNGFPDGEIEKVFDKFYRLKNAKTGGTGLGLSIAKGFVEAHNGTIRLENKVSGGAKFQIKIPTEKFWNYEYESIDH
ncbi:MAG TPA: ATP-binding protein [Puia sp.]|nr:ATP-binding protein [Puia sp.]